MFDRVGSKIKILATVLFFLEAAAAVIGGIILIADSGDVLLGLLLVIGGPGVALVMSWFVYGFGEIIDKLCAIEKNTRAGAAPEKTESPVVSFKKPAPKAPANLLFPASIIAAVALGVKLLCYVLCIYNYGEEAFFGSVMPILSTLIAFAPFVLLVLYIFKFYKKNKAQIIMPVIYALPILSCVISVINYLIVGYLTEDLIIPYLITAVLYGVPLYAALRGIKNKLFVIIPFSLCIYRNLISIVDVLDYGRYLHSIIFYTASINIASILFSVAIILFAIHNAASAPQTTPNTNNDDFNFTTK